MTIMVKLCMFLCSGIYIIQPKHLYITPFIFHPMKMKIKIPYATMSQVIEMLEKMYPRNVSETELSVFSGMSNSTISNITPTVRTLGLIEKEKDKISFTEDGLNFIKALKTNNEKKMRKIIRKNIEGNSVFEFVIHLLQKHKILRNQEIGEKLSIEFNRSWSHPQTFARYGTCVADIVAFAGFGHYSDGILSLREIRKRERISKLTIPDVYVRKIKDICDKLRISSGSLSELSEILDTSEKRLATELANCVALGLIDRGENIYILSKKGNEFINPMFSEEKKKMIFRECLLQGEYSKIIYELAKSKEEFRTRDVGKLLAFKLRRGWNEATRETVSKKFIDWLVYGEIVNKVERGCYEINGDFLEEVNEIFEREERTTEGKYHEFQKDKEKIVLETSKIFQIGKLLERIKVKISNNMKFEKEILELLSLCSSVPQLKDISSLVESHYEIYKEVEEKRILLPDLELIDKILGGEV